MEWLALASIALLLIFHWSRESWSVQIEFIDEETVEVREIIACGPKTELIHNPIPIKACRAPLSKQSLFSKLACASGAGVISIQETTDIKEVLGAVLPEAVKRGRGRLNATLSYVLALTNNGIITPPANRLIIRLHIKKNALSTVAVVYEIHEIIDLRFNDKEVYDLCQ